MAYQAAKGNGPATGMPKTPAPDEVTNIRAPSAPGYGMNGVQPSSVPPGKAVLSPLAANLKSSVTDDAIDSVIANGTARNDKVTSQLRTIAAGNVATAHGMKGPDNSARVPSKIGATNAAPARKV
jgi:hypothetical protein